MENLRVSGRSSYPLGGEGGTDRQADCREQNDDVCVIKCWAGGKMYR